jgi:Zn-dependent M28 family amino/carboxypeptidase
MMKLLKIILILTILTVLGIALYSKTTSPPEFSGERAFQYAEKQLSFGPRFIGSEGHLRVQKWIKAELENNGWEVVAHTFDFYSQTGKNLIAFRDSEAEFEDWIIIGAHYDTRLFADEDPDPSNRDQPVLGANDGASGVAVLLELSRSLPKMKETKVWMVFFDAEDNGNIRNYDWIQGSTYFANQLTEFPDKVIIVDMIGDTDQNIYLEITSDRALAVSIWRVAENLRIDTFIMDEKYAILDDHTPFLRKGISSVDIIDFDYPYWHTTSDTLDKISSQSLKNVGDVLLTWLLLEDSNSDIVSE